MKRVQPAPSEEDNQSSANNDQQGFASNGGSYGHQKEKEDVIVTVTRRDILRSAGQLVASV